MSWTVIGLLAIVLAAGFAIAAVLVGAVYDDMDDAEIEELYGDWPGGYL